MKISELENLGFVADSMFQNSMKNVVIILVNWFQQMDDCSDLDYTVNIDCDDKCYKLTLKLEEVECE